MRRSFFRAPDLQFDADGKAAGQPSRYKAR